MSAPGGWFRDGLGTPSDRTNENLILSTYPVNALQASGQVDAEGNITAAGTAGGVIKECPTPETPFVECGYYAYLQGTSMASPHVTGVAALAVSAWGKGRTADTFGLKPNAVRRIVMNTARNHACPVGGVQSYEDVGRGAEFTATCNGTDDFNAFYGDGIVDGRSRNPGPARQPVGSGGAPRQDCLHPRSRHSQPGSGASPRRGRDGRRPAEPQPW